MCYDAVPTRTVGSKWRDQRLDSRLLTQPRAHDLVRVSGDGGAHLRERRRGKQVGRGQGVGRRQSLSLSILVLPVAQEPFDNKKRQMDKKAFKRGWRFPLTVHAAAVRRQLSSRHFSGTCSSRLVIPTLTRRPPLNQPSSDVSGMRQERTS